MGDSRRTYQGVEDLQAFKKRLKAWGYFYRHTPETLKLVQKEAMALLEKNPQNLKAHALLALA